MIVGLPLIFHSAVHFFISLHVFETSYGYAILNDCLERMQAKGKAWDNNSIYGKILKMTVWKPNGERLSIIIIKFICISVIIANSRSNLTIIFFTFVTDKNKNRFRLVNTHKIKKNLSYKFYNLHKKVLFLE